MSTVPRKPSVAAGIRRWAGIALALLLLAGCAGLPDSGKPLAATAPQSEPVAGENAAAAQGEHQRILAAYGGAYEDLRLQSLLNATLAKLVAASERPDLHYEVTILNSPAVNAFALPNGQLYITRGLVALASDEAEIASVLAHEMGHVIARHAMLRAEQVRQAALVSKVVTDVLSDPQMGALALAKSKIALASFSRSQEFEADAIGVGIAGRAGYDPYGAVRFLTAMEHNADLRPNAADPRSLEFLSSHPATPDRIVNARLNARQFSAPGGGAKDKAAFQAVIDGLVYGEDPSEGYVRGRRFVHPKLGFTFTAPPGFSLENTAQAVLGIKEGGSEALRVDAVKVPAEQTLSSYLNSGWIENVDASSVEDTTVNGLPAASAIARGDQWSFRLYVVRFGSEVYRFIFAAKNRTPEVDRSFQQSVATFRRMSVAESAAAKPLRIRIVTVGPGDSVDSMVKRMGNVDHALERFRFLNGLSARDKLAAGDRVKIVTE